MWTFWARGKPLTSAEIWTPHCPSSSIVAVLTVFYKQNQSVVLNCDSSVLLLSHVCFCFEKFKCLIQRPLFFKFLDQLLVLTTSTVQPTNNTCSQHLNHIIIFSFNHGVCAAKLLKQIKFYSKCKPSFIVPQLHISSYNLQYL